jgi:hypothetical protein
MKNSQKTKNKRIQELRRKRKKKEEIFLEKGLDNNEKMFGTIVMKRSSDLGKEKNWGKCRRKRRRKGRGIWKEFSIWAIEKNFLFKTTLFTGLFFIFKNRLFFSIAYRIKQADRKEKIQGKSLFAIQVFLKRKPKEWQNFERMQNEFVNFFTFVSLRKNIEAKVARFEPFCDRDEVFLFCGTMTKRANRTFNSNSFSWKISWQVIEKFRRRKKESANLFLE